MNLFDPSQISQLEQGYQQQYQAARQATAAQAAPQSRPRNLLEALLPAAGATALGLAAAPFTGGLSLLPTLAVIGGASALGGGLGEFGAQKANNEKTDLGSILKEGVISGALGAGGEGLNAVRDVRAASGIAEAAQGAQPAKVGLIESLGKGLRTGAGGYGVGAKVTGEQQLTAAGSDAIGNTLKALKIPATAPETQARILETRLGNIENNLSSAYAKADTPVTTQEINNLGSKIIGDVAEAPGIGATGQKFALQEAEKLAKAGTSVDNVWQYIKGLEHTSINFGKGTSAALADKDAAARIIRQNVRDFLDSKVPGVAEKNALYHQAKTAQNFILDAAKDKGGGLIQRLASSAPAKMAEAKAGAAIENLGKATSKLGTVAAPMATQTIPRVLGGDYQLSQDSMNGPTAQMAAQTMNDQNSAVPPTAAPYQLSDTTSNNPFDPANIQANVAKLVAGGATLKDINDYVTLASTINSIQKAAAPNMVKPTGQQYGLAQGGMNSLQQLAQIIQQDPGVVERNSTPGQGIPLIGSYITNAAGAGDYHALADNVLQSLIHLQTGATATPEEVKAARGQLPAPGDTAEERFRKINNLAAMFAPYIQGGQIGGTSSNISDLLSALGGAS